jgi:6-phosphogluconolactonase
VARFAYLGTHNGLYCYTIDPTSGDLLPLSNPECDTGVLTAVAGHPSGKFLYATDSTANAVRAYQIDAVGGAITQLPGAEASAGVNPVSMAVHPSGQFLYVGNYNSDSVSAYSINATTGALTPVRGSPFATGHLPNAIVIDPSGQYLYTPNNGANNVSGFAINPDTGALTPAPNSPFSTGVTSVPQDPLGPTFAAALSIDPAGRFAFVGNYATAQISAFTLDRSTGELTPVTGSPFSDSNCLPPTIGPSPGGCSAANLSVDASGKYLYVFDSVNSIAGFAIDGSTGALTLLPASPFTALPYSGWATANGPYLYVSNNGSPSSVSTFTIDAATGTLTQNAGSPVAASPDGGAYNLTLVP